MSEITLRILVRRNENEGPVIMGCVGSDYDREFVAECGINSIGVPEYGLWVWEGWGEAYQGAEDSDYLLYGEFRPALTSDLPQFVQSNRKELIPHQLTPPGHILAKELEARGMTFADLGESGEWTVEYWRRVCEGSQEIRLMSSFIRLEEVLGIPAEFWVNAQLQYSRWVLAKLSEAGKAGALAGEAFRKFLQEGADHDPQTN